MYLKFQIFHVIFMFLSFFPSLSELEALGDDMFAEDDSSYLDEPINAPAAPETAPGGESMKVCIS